MALDRTVRFEITLSALTEFAQLRRDLADRHVTLWIAALPPPARDGA